MGMVRAAWPEPETTKKLMTDWSTSMSQAQTAARDPAQELSRPVEEGVEDAGLRGLVAAQDEDDALGHAHHQGGAEEVPRPLRGSSWRCRSRSCRRDGRRRRSTPATTPMTKNWLAISGM